jgi:hypothetical protein
LILVWVRIFLNIVKLFKDVSDSSVFGSFLSLWGNLLYPSLKPLFWLPTTPFYKVTENDWIQDRTRTFEFDACLTPIHIYATDLMTNKYASVLVLTVELGTNWFGTQPDWTAAHRNSSISSNFRVELFWLEKVLFAKKWYFIKLDYRFSITQLY